MEQIQRLELFKDDLEDHKEKEREKIMKEFAEKEQEIQSAMELAMQERDDARKELSNFKEDYNNKMSNIKMMELELEEKLANA